MLTNNSEYNKVEYNLLKELVINIVIHYKKKCRNICF